MALLSVENLTVKFDTTDGRVTAVDNLSFEIEENQTLGVVGESGSGKSQTAFGILGLLAKNGWAEGSARLSGNQLIGLPEKALNRLRANEVAVIFQDPMTSLNPYMKVEKQLCEVLIRHKGMGQGEAAAESVRMLEAVKIPEASKRIKMYPHELSGGMRQRVMIAMALLCKPKLLIADEPTTALDVTVQAQILTLLRELQKDFHTSIILITHDLGVIAGICDEVLVMYGGRTMEKGETRDLFYHPLHPYTKGLLGASPRLDSEGGELPTIQGNPPNLMNMPPGCPFQDRCPESHGSCTQEIPELRPAGKNRWFACHLTEKELNS